MKKRDLHELPFEISPDWTLFLDRDGVINKLLVDAYVTRIEEFEFVPGSLEAIALLSGYFQNICIVTNQQGIGKQIMTHEQLALIHTHMLENIHMAGGNISEIYYAPDLDVFEPYNRKPNPGMAMQAKLDFPEIVFRRSIMVGDSLSDMEFGRRLEMKTVFVTGSGSGGKKHIQKELNAIESNSHMIVQNLKEFAQMVGYLI